MSTQTEAQHYPNHDAEALGQDYINHISAMTAEGLRAKSSIAVQLAWRDVEIRRLEAEVAMTTILHGRLTQDAIKAQNKCIELEAANAELLETLYRLAYIRTNMEFPPVRSIAEEMRIIAQTAFNKHRG